jgi:hypothetical protein
VDRGAYTHNVRSTRGYVLQEMQSGESDIMITSRFWCSRSRSCSCSCRCISESGTLSDITYSRLRVTCVWNVLWKHWFACLSQSHERRYVVYGDFEAETQGHLPTWGLMAEVSTFEIYCATNSKSGHVGDILHISKNCNSVIKRNGSYGQSWACLPCCRLKFNA